MENESRKQALLWELARSKTGAKLRKYASNDASNKLAIREDTIFDNIARILRSRVAKNALISANIVDESELEAFRQKWTSISPLYPSQSAALRRNHYSKAHLKKGQAAGKAHIPVVYMENDREERTALAWFNGLNSRDGMLAILTAHNAFLNDGLVEDEYEAEDK